MTEQLQLLPRKPYVFIVYQNFESKLAVSLQNLLQGWGCDVFQCRQDLRDGQKFPVELRENIRKCDLVVLLFSREFQWAAYCHAETGTAMALEKPHISVIVPPVDENEVVTRIAKIMQGTQFLSAADPNFIEALQLSIVLRLKESPEGLKRLIARLQTLEAANLSDVQPINLAKDNENRKDVRASIQAIANEYRLYQPTKILSSAWASLRDPDCQTSIIGNIVKSLTAATDSETFLTFVGVSLKFSLDLISDALKEYSSRNIDPSTPPKKLSITLVHMDDQAHILHSLKDTIDIDIIREKFGSNLAMRIDEWKSMCGSSLQLAGPTIYRIDYIPPRVGILIGNPDNNSSKVLYAGRCGLREEGNRTLRFHLDVGENEYIFYRKDPSTPPSDIASRTFDEFRASLQAYKQKKINSGVTPIWGSDSWVERLRAYIDVYSGKESVTFISGSATKFRSLIKCLLQRNIKVRVYVNDCDVPSQRCQNLYNDLKEHIGVAAKEIEILCYEHPATFRGIIIGDVAIGIQVYINTAKKALRKGPRKVADSMETAKAIPLCFIITPCFENFEKLKLSMLAFADGDPRANDVFKVFE